MFVKPKYEYQVRIIVIMLMLLLMAFTGIVRVAALATDKSFEKYLDNFVTVQLESGRGDFLDCNGIKLTGYNKSFLNLFLPCESAKKKFFENATEQEKKVGENRFLNNKPATLRRSFEISGVGVYSFEVSDRYENDLALQHIIGYVNSENNGVAGLEKCFNEKIKGEEPLTASFNINALGEYLIGAKPILNPPTGQKNIKLTIDRKIQEIVADSMKEVSKGAAVVTEISTGKIKAMVSKPLYDVDNIAKYLNEENSPFINRAINCYSPGSVFKPIIAAALIENSFKDFTHNCTGVTDISGLAFHCYNRAGHGELDMSEAIYHSCNCYFYNAIGLIKPISYLNLTTSLMFTTPIKLADNLFSFSGSMPTESSLNNSAVAANFSIGQGSVLVSPLAMCNLYSAIANEGAYYIPSLLEDEPGEKCFVMSKGTAAELKEYLSYVVSFGTGKKANPDNITAAGKTATAQTGVIKNETELNNVWFCGFFPKEKPKYSVTVFIEDAVSGGDEAAPVFKAIADGIYLP
ncbi:MAG: penicillin-binding protein 2 [Clostridia bacterium]|nr:penicillin-binding protein 2 [Clostridia bacterium]